MNSILVKRVVLFAIWGLIASVLRIVESMSLNNTSHDFAGEAYYRDYEQYHPLHNIAAPTITQPPSAPPTNSQPPTEQSWSDWIGQGISATGDWIYDNASFLGHTALDLLGHIPITDFGFQSSMSAAYTNIASAANWAMDSWVASYATSLPGAVLDSFYNGSAWDSFQAASTQMLDTMLFGLTDFSDWLDPLYGNTNAHQEGETVGTIWGNANWGAITFGSWVKMPAGSGIGITHWAKPGINTLESGNTYWVMRGGPSVWNYVMSGVIQPGKHFRWPWQFITDNAVHGTLSAPRGWESIKWLFGQRIFKP